MNNNKADGLDALASAAAGTQSDEQMRAHISSKETGSSTAHPDASAPQGLTLSNLNPHQQQLLAEFVKNHSSSSPAANNSKAVNASPSASSSLLGNLSQMNANNNNNPLATLQGLQQQIASQQLLQLLMNRTAQASGGASSNHTPKQAPPAAPTGSTHGNNYLDSQNLHKLQALLSGIQAQSNLGKLIYMFDWLIALFVCFGCSESVRRSTTQGACLLACWLVFTRRRLLRFRHVCATFLPQLH